MSDETTAPAPDTGDDLVTEQPVVEVPTSSQASPEGTPAQPESTVQSLAGVSLAFSVLGFTFLPFLGSLVAVICGHAASRRARRALLVRPASALAGLILGWVGLILSLLAVLALAALIPLALSLVDKASNAVEKGRDTVSSTRQSVNDALSAPGGLDGILGDGASSPSGTSGGTLGDSLGTQLASAAGSFAADAAAAAVTELANAQVAAGSSPATAISQASSQLSSDTVHVQVSGSEALLSTQASGRTCTVRISLAAGQFQAEPATCS